MYCMRPSRASPTPFRIRPATADARPGCRARPPRDRPSLRRAEIGVRRVGVAELSGPRVGGRRAEWARGAGRRELTFEVRDAAFGAREGSAVGAARAAREPPDAAAEKGSEEKPDGDLRDEEFHR